MVDLDLGLGSALLVSDPDAFKHILRDRAKQYAKPEFFYRPVRASVGNGLVTSQGDFWLRQRRMIQPFLHRKYLVHIVQTMADAIEGVLESWTPHVLSGQTIDVFDEMSRVTMSVVSRAVFGHDLPAATFAEIAEIFPKLLDYINLRGFMPFIPTWVPLPGQRRFGRDRARMTELIRGVIESRRSAGGETMDLVSMMLNAVDDETNARMTDQQLIDESMTVFLAGFETTATALTWLWYALRDQPELRARLAEEADDVLDADVTPMEAVGKLELTRRVVSEAMRLYPPAPLLPRTALADDVIGGHRVPAGKTVLMFYYGLHHNPAVWHEPERFDPSRFEAAAVAERSRFAWIPFSAGPRGCVGDQFAMTEALLTAALVSRRFDLVVESRTVEPRFGATLRPSGAIRARLRARTATSGRPPRTAR